jgi:5-methylcytosine-specific restriction endonuclease McrA
MQDGSWRTDKQSAAQRGYGHKWREARSAFLKSHPLCVYCQRAGRITAASVVDHIIPHRGDMALFWDRSLWQGLCTHCHNTIKAQEEGRHAAKSTFDASGRVVW